MDTRIWHYERMRDIIAAKLRASQYATLEDWVEKKRLLSSKNSEPGKFSFDRTPYLREIMRELSPQSLTYKVVVMKAPQLGMTELATSWMLYTIDTNPATMYYVTVTNDEARKYVRTRFDPERKIHPFLNSRWMVGRSGTMVHNAEVKCFIGGEIFFTSGNTTTPFRSRSVKNVIVDEAEKLPSNIGGEGDPIQLLENRQKTFYDKKMLVISTPSIEEEMVNSRDSEIKRSIIQREYLRGDRRKYYVPCPLCSEFQTLEFEQLIHSFTDKGAVLYGYLCIHCGGVFQETEKHAMLLKGEWRPTVETEDIGTKSYHINGLYSPMIWQTWNYHVALYYGSLKDRLKRINFENNTLALPFNETSLGLKAEQLLARREDYNTKCVSKLALTKKERIELPSGILFLTAGVDVHKARLECSIWGWGLGMESWFIDHRQISAVNSSNISDVCWLSLDSYLQNTWMLSNGTEVALEHSLIDMGYNSDTVLSFCMSKEYAYLPAKGVASGIVAVKQTSSQGVGRINVNTDILKTTFYARLRDIAHGEIGYVHFPKSMDSPEFYRQIVSEKKVYVNGKSAWRKTRLRNEALDCAIYAMAGALYFGLQEWTETEAELYLKHIK